MFVECPSPNLDDCNCCRHYCYSTSSCRSSCLLNRVLRNRIPQRVHFFTTKTNHKHCLRLCQPNGYSHFGFCRDFHGFLVHSTCPVMLSERGFNSDCLDPLGLSCNVERINLEFLNWWSVRKRIFFSVDVLTCWIGLSVLRVRSETFNVIGGTEHTLSTNVR